jgi:hypothetical protein
MLTRWVSLVKQAKSLIFCVTFCKSLALFFVLYHLANISVFKPFFYHSYATFIIHTRLLLFVHDFYHSYTTFIIRTRPLSFVHDFYHSYTTFIIRTRLLSFVLDFYHSYTTFIIRTRLLSFVHDSEVLIIL